MIMGHSQHASSAEDVEQRVKLLGQLVRSCGPTQPCGVARIEGAHDWSCPFCYADPDTCSCLRPEVRRRIAVSINWKATKRQLQKEGVLAI